jgi:hypothetical protein
MRFVLTVACFSYFCLAVTPPEGKPPTSTQYDGHWWLSRDPKEQQGFVSGAADCYIWEVKEKLRHSKSAAEDQSSITRFYREDTSRLDRSALEVFLDAADQPSQYPAQKGGEVWKEPHGYYDGQWWREAESAERLGFVEGYLACYTQKTKQLKGEFATTPLDLVSLISGWYGFKEDDRSVEPAKETTKIADVLFHFSEKSDRRPATHQKEK